MPLTELQCKSAKCPPDKARVKLTDGLGMYLEVTPSGSKYWRLKYRLDGREKVEALGVYPAVTLAKARQARDRAREHIAGGLAPVAARRQADAIKVEAKANTFEVVARQWWASWKVARSARHADYVMRRLEADVFPEIGATAVSELRAVHVVEMARKMAERGVLDLSKRSMQTCGQILRYAVTKDLIERNPMDGIKPTDAQLPSRRAQNYARLDAKEMTGLLRKIEAYQGTPVTRLAMKLMALTFVRTGELINAPWSEFDLELAEWRIPASRMKMPSPHVVPLAPQAVEVLQALQTITGRGVLLFPGERDHGKPMSNNTILKALERMGYKGRMTGHGFRGVASTILHELGYPHHIIELQLAHQERDEISAAYNYAEHLAERRAMMNDWAKHLDAMRAGAQVIPFKRQAG